MTKIRYALLKFTPPKIEKTKHYKSPFPLRAWKRAFFVSFIDLRLKREQKKSIKQTKNVFFHARSGNGP